MKNPFKYLLFASILLFCISLLAQKSSDTGALKESNKFLTQNADKTLEAVDFAKTKSNNLLLLTIFLAGGIIGGLTIYFYSRSCINSILSRERSTYLEDLKISYRGLIPYIGMVRRLKASKDEKKGNIDELEEKVMKLQKEIKILEKELSGQKYIEKNENPILSVRKELYIEPQSGSPQEKDIKQNNLYFTVPFNDGSFNNDNKILDKTPRCFYKIVQKNENTGDLYFIPGEFDKTALNNITGYLSPVCEIENIEDRLNATKISLLKPGKVLLSNGRWLIENNNKVQIKLT